MRALYAILGLAFVLALAMPQPAGAQEVKKEAKEVVGKKAEKSKAAVDSAAVIEVDYDGKHLGSIVFKFYPELAPNHVANFRKLANRGFYDGITFHRVIAGFMIQAGDPNTKDDDRGNDGYGGPGYTIKAEFSEKSHKRGIVSMARGTDPNSAGSQFFIVTKDAPHLNGQYSVFGEVIQGMDVVDKIEGVQVDPKKKNPLKKVIMTDVSIVPLDSVKKAKGKK